MMSNLRFPHTPHTDVIINKDIKKEIDKYDSYMEKADVPVENQTYR